MAYYSVKGKHAIVTGAGSGINLVFARMLLEAGCSVILADVKLRPEAEELVMSRFPSSSSGPAHAAAIFHPTDVSNWAQLSALWGFALTTFPRIDMVVNGAGIYEPPSSTFWNAPGSSSSSSSPLARDAPDQTSGVYHTFAVNTMGPIRLAQMAVDYWLEHREHVSGNLLWVGSVGSYVHSIQTPLYFSSKAAVMSFVKSLAGMKKNFGIRNAMICPGVVNTPIFHPDWCRDRVRPDDFTMTPEQCASIMMRIATEPEFGDGNIVEAILAGTRETPVLSTREVPLQLLYPDVGPVGEDNHLIEEEINFTEHVKKYGMRVPYTAPSARKTT